MSIESAAGLLADNLKLHDKKVVFAESCTGGRVCGSLTAVAGISQYLCGGFVVYRNESKEAWLGLDLAALNERGAVRAEVANEMAAAALSKTPEADFAVAVTGHLGPHAPDSLDGVVFVGKAHRNQPAGDATRLHCRHLPTRNQRQDWVVEQVLLLASSR